MSEYNKSLFRQCAEKIKRWPRLNASCFPELPNKCNFIVSGLGGYKLEIYGRVFTEEQVNREKLRIKKLDKNQ